MTYQEWLARMWSVWERNFTSVEYSYIVLQEVEIKEYGFPLIDLLLLYSA
jgi:hypothetical protein